ncbi:MAG: 7,8-dihydropterin-6-yl-methyl-4-(beta-D-ribofuranosyl)aminobenzene 5-phosphate synthase [Solirubrobacteraceae bacterium]|nr:7,8-dihydropterin-6-yl-methyl-4-(beta-D-ribofuranosyl)aminobenzene 5-phosphate synthase [Solirubrobacteraceae bacterium]
METLRARITSVTENYVDMLLADEENVSRAGLFHHFDPKRTPPIGENGIALLVELEWGRYSYRALFDTGMTGHVLLHNASALGIDLGELDHVVISHGHPDHYGGLRGLLESRAASLPISIHPDAFLPRYLRLASGEVAPFYNSDLSPGALDDAGGRVVSHKGPLEVGPGLIATGEIPRNVAFEAPSVRTDTPNALLQVKDAHVCADVVEDDQALVLEIADGIVVLVGCSHAGVVNSIRHAIELTGKERVLGVFGGFHLGFPGVPEEKTQATIESLREIGVEMLCPMHCTGMHAMMEMRRALPEQFVMNCTGTRVDFAAAAIEIRTRPSTSGARRS